MADKGIIDYGENSTVGFPDQFISSNAKKRKSWQEANAKYFKGLVNSEVNESRRKSKRERELLWRLVEGKLNAADIAEIYNPLKAKGVDDKIPDKAVSYNIIKQPFLTLIGEELRRKTDVRCVAVNPEVINQKDLEYKAKFLEYVTELQTKIQQGVKLPEEAIQKELERLDYYVKYEQQSAHEKMGNEVIRYVYHDPYINIRNVFNKGWQEKVVTGESAYRIGSIGSAIRVTNINPDNFIVLGMGSSDFIEDGTAWIEWDYVPLARIMEEFHKDLTKAQIKSIQTRLSSFPSEGVFQKYIVPFNDANQKALEGENPLLSLYGLTPSNGDYMTSVEHTDIHGNILVLRFQWISALKVALVTYFDENDVEKTRYESEEYKVNEDAGETVEWLWVDDLWEGVMIADELIYCRPSPVQMRSLENPSMVRSCYVGSLVTYGMSNKASSLLDDVIPYSRDYDLYANKLRKQWAMHIGNVLRIDKSRIAKDINPDDYISFLKDVGISIEDSMNVSDDQLTRVGNMQAYNPVVAMSMANEMKETINMLNYIKGQIKEVLSLPDSRTGQMSGNEGLGVSQQSAIQAMSGTEYMSRMHDMDKVRVFTVLLEYVKYAWSEYPVRKQYLLSDQSQYVLDYDSSLMEEAELGVVMSNSSDMAMLMQKLNPTIQAFAQNGTIAFSDIVDMEFANSASELKRLLEAAEDKTARRQQEANAKMEEEKRKTLEMQAQYEEKAFQRQAELLRLKYQYEAESRLAERSMDFAAEAMADENGDGVVDDIELRKAEMEQETAFRKIESEERRHAQEMALKAKEINIKSKQATKKL